MRTFNRRVKRIVPVVAALALTAGLATPAGAATSFTSVSKSTSSAVPAATGVIDTFAVAGPSATAIGCVTVKYSLNGNGSGSIPGFAVTAAGSSNTVLAGTTAAVVGGNVVEFKRTGTAVPANGNVIVGGITNGTGTATYYAEVATFVSATCSGAALNSTVVGFVYTDGTVVSVTIDPTLTFTVTGRATACSAQGTPANTSTATSMDLGRINGSLVGSGSQNLAVGSNAAGGVSVKVRGASASGNLAGVAGAPFAEGGTPTAGTAAFSFTATEVGGWGDLNTTGTEVVRTTGPSDGTSTGIGCIGFSASAAANTPAGSYAANVFYTAVPTF